MRVGGNEGRIIHLSESSYARASEVIGQRREVAGTVGRQLKVPSLRHTYICVLALAKTRVPRREVLLITPDYVCSTGSCTVEGLLLC